MRAKLSIPIIVAALVFSLLGVPAASGTTSELEGAAGVAHGSTLENDEFPMMDYPNQPDFGSTARAEIAAASTAGRKVTFVRVKDVNVTEAEMRMTDANLGNLSEVVSRVSRYWERNTDGATRISEHALVPGWLNFSGSCTDFYETVKAAGDYAGFNRTSGEHLAVIIPNGYDGGRSCFSPGIGEVGVSPTSHGARFILAGNPIEPVRYSVMAHEFGHNLGLGHANTAQCQPGVDFGVLNGAAMGCDYQEYGDILDIMGTSWVDDSSGDAGTLSPFNLRKLEVRSGDLPHIYNSTYLRVRATDLPASNVPRYPIIVGDQEYYLEYRRAAGPNTWLMNKAGENSGIIVRRVGEKANQGTAYIVRDRNGKYSETIDVGESLVLPSVRIEHIEGTWDHAVVKVVIDGIPPYKGNHKAVPGQKLTSVVGVGYHQTKKAVPNIPMSPSAGTSTQQNKTAQRAYLR